MGNSSTLETPGGYDVGIDFGTSKCAMYWASLGEELNFWPVILEGNSEILRSAVYVQPAEDGRRSFCVGEQALEAFLSRGVSDRYFTGFKLHLGEEFPMPQYSLLRVTPAALGSVVFRRLLETAAEPGGTLAKGGPILRATITHPAGWEVSKRNALREAAEAAGLESVHFIEEPIAALYHARRIEHMWDWDGKLVMVVDYGGGTCDVAVCRLPKNTSEDTRPELLSSKTLTHGVGGEEVTIRLAGFLRERLVEAWHGLPDVPAARDLLRTLARNAEIAKHRYSEWYYTGRKKGEPPITVLIRPPSGLDDLAPVEVSISETDFSQIAKPIVDNVSEPIRLVLDELSIDRREIDIVYLAGGACRVPLARQLVENWFGSGKVAWSSNPRKEIAYGAAYSEWFERRTKQRSYKGVKVQKTLLIAEQKRRPWRALRGKSAVEVAFRPLVKAGARVDSFRTPKLYRLVVPEEGRTEVVIPIYEQPPDDGATVASYNSTTLKFDRPVAKGTRIDVWYSLDYDGRLVLRAEVRVDDHLFETPKIVGPLVVDEEQIQKIRLMAGIVDPRESAADGNERQ